MSGAYLEAPVDLRNGRFTQVEDFFKQLKIQAKTTPA